MRKHPYQTMSLAFQQICQGERDWTALGNFMNDWYDNHVDERERLIIDPLPENYPPEFHQWAVFCAASVEWFAHKYGVPCPEWVYDSRYMLIKPWFYGMGETRKELRQVTPPEFASRNIFCGDRVYANKWELVDEIRLRYADRLAEIRARRREEQAREIAALQQ